MSLQHEYDKSERRWESYWRRECPTTDYDVADAVAQVDRLEREGLGPLSISFKEARAYAALHGARCACHNPDPVVAS